MKKLLRSASLCLCAVLTLTSTPLSAVQAAASKGGKEVYVTGFEDGDVSKFSKRGDDDTSVIKASSAEPHSGDYCMEITERDQGWNGPSIALKDLCEPGVLYVASAWVKAKWYNSCKLSMQYTDSEGVQHYNNLSKATSQGEWVKIPEIRFCLFDSMKDVSLYIECDDKADLCVDDFSLTEAPYYEIEQDIPGLKDVFNDCFKLGGAVTASEIAAKSTQALVLKHYNSLTLGNELKPENMLRQKATQELYEETGDNTSVVVKLNDAARYILDFCRKYKIPVRGHVLVWYSQTPYWFFTEDFTTDGKIVGKETMLKRMENYIKGVFAVLDEEYPDIDFYAWDVVNEAFLDGGGPREPGKYEDYNGSSAWVKIFGDNSFIEPAFKYARQYARPNTKLYYNDFNEYMKVDAMLKLGNDLHEKGLLDGLGLQSHLDVTNNSTSDPFPSVQQYAAALDKFCASGLDIQITELDATCARSVSGGDSLQAKYYKGIMDAIVKNKDKISAVVFWGTTDDQSWRADRKPLLFDGEYKAKSCFNSIVEGREYTTGPSTQTTTTTTTSSSSSEEQPELLGDVDCNGVVQVADAILLARYVAEDKVNITTQGRKNAELSGDSTLTSDDISVLLRYLAGIVKELTPVRWM